ncbi:MAG: DUF2905 domain-containing protein [Candidatus Methylomirabilales bacterium]
MSVFDQFGRGLVLFGIVMVVLGVLLIVGGRVPFLGRLPGDILIERRNFTFYFPLATSILLSVVLTLLFTFFGRR